MMGAIRNLLGVPIAPPDLAPTTTLHNPTSKDMESVEHTVRNSLRVPEAADDGVSVEGIVNAFPSDLVDVDTPVDAPGLMKICHQVARSMSGSLHFEDKDMESVEHTVRNSLRVPEVADDGVSVEGIVNAFPSDLVVVDTPVDAPGKGEAAKDQTLSNVIIACSLVSPSKTAQVADVNYTQADISLSFDII
ncbi:unnamed protein product [Cuscuta campestris]|uniref:Uncharacterized protein n=1 Tax=Cuscuta campestris TaxID=132261 RepID=A0A484NMN6_9ASTE|nr:unnamed protein product [Cuscuta campestris]